ncbi:uncharacterized PE-PGRS family protein PE_PGRS54-like [Vulpes lagopus]|uniref:uncharacterized PE-PGRS family protein PE_PGRS54-like n=1 Tax=Vulpes lagopus TaxID=494514 RepID=UPI001BC94957|nr:uncharacterized PE-PGRS family protein PE_PGRS54-like [Vulpes lagopus]
MAHAGPSPAGPLSREPGRPNHDSTTSSESVGVPSPPGSCSGAQPRCGEARPARVRRERGGRSGLVVARGSQGSWPGAPGVGGRAAGGGAGGWHRGAGSSPRGAPASLQPGLGRGSGSRALPAAAPPLPPALRRGRGPGPAGLPADGASGRGVEGARGARARRQAAGRAAGGGRTGPAARTRRAAGRARGARGSARDGAKEKLELFTIFQLSLKRKNHRLNKAIENSASYVDFLT